VKRAIRLLKKAWNNRSYRTAEFSIGYAFFALLAIGLVCLLSTRLSSLQARSPADAHGMESDSKASAELPSERSPTEFAPPEQWEFSPAWSLGMYAATTIVAVLLIAYALRRQAEKLKKWRTKWRVRKSVSGAMLESSMAKFAAAKSPDISVPVIQVAP
jgi:hypothetical protein